MSYICIRIKIEKQMTTEFTPLQEAYSMLSDMHKDAYGFRCRNYRNDLTIEEIHQEMDRLEVVIKQNIEQERLWEMEAEMVFKALLQKTIALGAGDEQTALRWLAEAEIDDPRNYFDVESFLYAHGMIHTDYGQSIKKRIIHMFG
jgi:uncharacterized protein YbcC (UPF0753/DUF2309 family)